MKLIPDWKEAFKLHSVWISFIGILFSGVSAGLALAYGVADSTQRSMLSPFETYAIFFLIFVGVIIGRLLRQGDGDE